MNWCPTIDLIKWHRVSVLAAFQVVGGMETQDVPSSWNVIEKFQLVWLKFMIL